ncbi:inositol monophosphatase family protein [Parvularcula lutaonensis]|uniref:Inositol monophosphatase family protein n=1 Tax=Parvularcula lutaonensis TaxID=491923 RepID=A0ABV7MGB9_9PROT|nr:3'(2'),5'-bisphosphate nucleotidase CysQ [Parvularcula lutaonensis]GGY54871.1 3'(2'),5'-bisphosphate nucleotidase CysQ [Parvularcula lutaonensis]
MLAIKRNALPTFENERDALIGAAVEAGHAIMPMWRDVSLDVWAKDDHSPVSEADLRANQILKEVLLHGARADYGWLSEECADDRSRLERERTIIVDPIDGTRAFVKGEDGFTVCLAITEGKDVIASVIYAPARDEIFAAARGAGASLNGKPIAASDCEGLEACRMLAQKRMFDHPAWPERWPSMDIHYRNSTSDRMAGVAAGRFDGTLALVPKADWDAAPGALIAEEAGAKVSDHLGRPLRFDRPKPEQPGLVCAAPGLYPHVIQRLSHLPADLRSIQK